MLALGVELDQSLGLLAMRGAFTCKLVRKRRGWDSNPRDDLTPPTRFPISKGHLTSFVRDVLNYPIASI